MESADDIFLAAREIAKPGERAAYLAQACGTDAALRQRVEAMLRDALSADAFFNQSEHPLVRAAGAPVTEKPGDRIGRYKLLEKIGEGGCGVVYVAEQEEPLRRRVALKVIKLGMDTKSVVARFEAERQALALMDYPNIAKVLDAGATETGRPFFVMELVRGIKITDYCDQNKLTTRERLDLFIQVCQAVQHAHQKGIIHRDLKPSNILVTVNDGVAVPKVIDFGIAKATQGRLTDKTVYTELHQFIGTPAYMSPEQAELTSVDIDTRSDIYSLGVLLYELLTGKTPFDTQELLRAGLDEMRRTIREREPLRPSKLVESLSQMRVEKPGGKTLNAQLKSLSTDLDWIVMKCLEKDRARRYPSASGLARDIERHLNAEPVAARPPSKAYLAGKFMRKHRVGVAAIASVVGALVIGLAASLWFYLQETRAHERADAAERQQSVLRTAAEAERTKALSEAAKSRQVAQFLQEMLKGVGPSVALGRDTKLLREILDKTAERLPTDLTNQPLVEAELRQTLGRVYNDLGEHGRAEQMYRQALALRRRHLGPEHAETAESLESVGSVLYDQGKFAEAEAAHREALAMRKKLLGPDNVAVAESLANLAETLHAQKKLAEAETLAREALALRRKLLGDEHEAVALSLNNLAGVLFDENGRPEAEQLLRQALGIQRKLLGNEHPDVLTSLNNLALVLKKQRKLAEAEVLYREVLATAEKVLEAHPHVARSLHNLASVLHEQDKLAEAEKYDRAAYEMVRKVCGPNEPVLPVCLNDMARVLVKEGKLAQAEALAQECLGVTQSRIPNPWQAVCARAILGGILLEQKAYADAEPLLLAGYAGLDKRRATLDRGGQLWLRQSLEALARVCEATGRPEQAADWKRKLAEFTNSEDGRAAPAPADGNRASQVEPPF